MRSKKQFFKRKRVVRVGEVLMGVSARGWWTQQAHGCKWEEEQFTELILHEHSH